MSEMSRAQGQAHQDPNPTDDMVPPAAQVPDSYVEQFGPRDSGAEDVGPQDGGAEDVGPQDFGAEDVSFKTLTILSLLESRCQRPPRRRRRGQRATRAILVRSHA